MDKDVIIDALKQHIDPIEYSLNDWDRIFERRSKYSSRISIYKCAFCDIYLYNDGSFYTADPHIPPSWGYNPTDDFSDDEIAIVDVLKRCLQPSDYSLNDWRSVLSRAERISDDVVAYDLSFVKIYLKDGEYYDAEPVEVDEDTKILESGLGYDESLKMGVIKSYVLPQHYSLINWKYVFRNVTQVRENVYLYPLGIMDLYLDENLKPVNYDRCHIINNNEFWYDFNPHPIVAGEQYTYITNI